MRRPAHLSERFHRLYHLRADPHGGSAQIQAIDLYGTVCFEPVGFAGVRLDYSLELRESSYTDPVLGGLLPVGFAEPFELELDWRHDIPATDLAWGGQGCAARGSAPATASTNTATII
ncbi:hypothetical protein [Aurantiacibacter suaedae]|uniref:hypothetical protein n=1 Tax=Aurantiacibacter suaedae TaxID=2545755 RepID=UPI0019D6030A|nr:hypothetical protein [Aurantiacibacter suaedae]